MNASVAPLNPFFHFLFDPTFPHQESGNFLLPLFPPFSALYSCIRQKKEEKEEQKETNLFLFLLMGKRQKKEEKGASPSFFFLL